jgi:hypothetical protein
MTKTTSLIVSLLAFTLCVASGWAATTTPPADTLKVDYFSNANTAGAPDGTLRITDPGTATGNVCASIFVFDPQQELTECCSCLLTPDGLRTLSVNTNLTSNPLTGVVLSTGLIKLVSTIPVSNACPLPTKVNPEASLRSWTTHIQNSSFAVTESASQDATLSTGEVTRLAAQCYAIKLDGSGSGICSCGTGD